jgi:hypothetical protein
VSVLLAMASLQPFQLAREIAALELAQIAGHTRRPDQLATGRYSARCRSRASGVNLAVHSPDAKVGGASDLQSAFVFGGVACCMWR